MNVNMKYVILELAEENIEGLLVKEDERYVVIKLSSGYNIGISRKKILNIKEKSEKNILEPKDPKAIIPEKRLEQKSDLSAPAPVAPHPLFFRAVHLSKPPPGLFAAPEELSQLLRQCCPF